MDALVLPLARREGTKNTRHFLSNDLVFWVQTCAMDALVLPLVKREGTQYINVLLTLVIVIGNLR